jgi:hypothetical protein
MIEGLVDTDAGPWMIDVFVVCYRVCCQMNRKKEIRRPDITKRGHGRKSRIVIATN